jgi:hypothetical protein
MSFQAKLYEIFSVQADGRAANSSISSELDGGRGSNSKLPTPSSSLRPRAARSRGTPSFTPLAMGKRSGTSSVAGSKKGMGTVKGEVREAKAKLTAIAEEKNTLYFEVFRRLVSVPQATVNAIEGQHRTSSSKASSKLAGRGTKGDTHSNSNDGFYRLFESFDKNRDGLISLSEFKSTLSELGLEMSEEECCMLFDRFETHKRDGFIDWQEFMHFYRGYILPMADFSSSETARGQFSSGSITIKEWDLATPNVLNSTEPTPRTARDGIGSKGSKGPLGDGPQGSRRLSLPNTRPPGGRAAAMSSPGSHVRYQFELAPLLTALQRRWCAMLRYVLSDSSDKMETMSSMLLTLGNLKSRSAGGTGSVAPNTGGPALKHGTTLSMEGFMAQMEAAAAVGDGLVDSTLTNETTAGVFTHLDLEHALDNAKILRLVLGGKDVSEEQMGRISRIFRYDVSAFLRFLNGVGSHHGAYELDVTAALHECTHALATYLFGQAELGVKGASKSGYRKAWAALAGLGASTVECEAAAQHMLALIRDHNSATAGGTIEQGQVLLWHHIEADVLVRLIADQLAYSAWNKSSQASSAGSAIASKASQGSTSRSRGQKPGLRSEISLSGFEAFAKTADTSNMERRLKYLLELELAKYSESRLFLVHAFVCPGTKELLILLLDPLTGRGFDFSLTDDKVALLPLGHDESFTSRVKDVLDLYHHGEGCFYETPTATTAQKAGSAPTTWVPEHFPGMATKGFGSPSGDFRPLSEDVRGKLKNASTLVDRPGYHCLRLDHAHTHLYNRWTAPAENRAIESIVDRLRLVENGPG